VEEKPDSASMVKGLNSLANLESYPDNKSMVRKMVGDMIFSTSDVPVPCHAVHFQLLIADTTQKQAADNLYTLLSLDKLFYYGTRNYA
jgi:hypothetical protein